LAIEQTSEHPIAKAIAHAARGELPSDGAKDIIVTNIETFAGAGTIGMIEGKRIAIGKESWLRTFPQEKVFQYDWLGEQKSCEASEAWIACDDQLVARIQVADEPRESTSRTLKQLKEMGMELYLLSGDRANAVEALAQRVGLTKYRSEVSPEMKRQEIESLKKLGKRVAMVGDGINDAPALATADVGIAMATGTDLAQQSSDITLLEGDLKRIADAIRLSRNVVKNVQQNLTLGLMYNVIAIPVAAGLLYPWTGWTLSPMLAAAAMAASSLSVVGNALRLRL
jgi:Cu+-exporting ATPase